MDRAALIDAAASAISTCCEECALDPVDPDGAAIRGVLDAVLPLIAKAILATPVPTTSDPTLYREGYEDGIGDAAGLVRSFGEQS